MTLKDFVETFCKYAQVRVESAFNGKCLAKRYATGKKPELDMREVRSVSPIIITSEDRNFAGAWLRIYVNGEREFNEEKAKREKLREIFDTYSVEEKGAVLA